MAKVKFEVECPVVFDMGPFDYAKDTTEDSQALFDEIFYALDNPNIKNKILVARVKSKIQDKQHDAQIGLIYEKGKYPYAGQVTRLVTEWLDSSRSFGNDELISWGYLDSICVRHQV